MIRIKIITLGKNKEAWLHDALAEYEKRLKPYCSILWILAKNLVQLEEFSIQEKFIALDPQGKLMTTEQFEKWFEKQGSRLTLVIGGPEGLSPQIKEKALFLLSLSPLTFTHQLTRLILLEQIYRVFEIRKGSAYHK